MSGSGTSVSCGRRDSRTRAGLTGLFLLYLLAGVITHSGADDELLTGEWIITGIIDAVLLEGSHPEMGFTDEGRFSATAGCNRMASSYETDDTGGIRIGMLAATRMMCPEPLMAQEDALMMVLDLARRYTVGDGVLTLSDAAGKELLTAAIKESPKKESPEPHPE